MITKIYYSLLLSILSVASVSASSGEYSVEEYGPYTNIGMIILGRETVIDNGLQFSPDGSGFAFVYSNSDFRKAKSLADMKYTLVENGVEKSEYDTSYFRTYAPVGNSFAYVAKKDGKDFIVKDEIEGEKYDEIKSFPIYSPDATSIAYVAKKDEKEFVVKDGVEGEKYDEIQGIPVYSPDSKSIAYVARREYKDVLVKDEVEIGTFESYGIRGMLFGPDNTFIYIVHENGKEYVVREGKRGKGYDSIYFPLFSPDGKDFIYKTFAESATGGYQSLIVKNEVEGPIYRDIYRIGYSPDGKYFFFLGSTIDNKNVLVINEKEYENFSNGPSPVFSSGGTSYAFVMKKDDKSVVVKDGEEIGEYDYVTELQYVPGSDELSYTVMDKDGKKTQMGSESDSAQEMKKVYSGDGKSITVIEKSGSGFSVKKDGEELGTFPFVFNVVYSSDNQKLAITAGTLGESSVFVYTFTTSEDSVTPIAGDQGNDEKTVSSEVPIVENIQPISASIENTQGNSGNTLFYILGGLAFIILSIGIFQIVRKGRSQNRENIVSTSANTQFQPSLTTIPNPVVSPVQPVATIPNPVVSPVQPVATIPNPVVSPQQENAPNISINP